MKKNTVNQALRMNWTGMLSETYIKTAVKTLGQLRQIFHNAQAAAGIPAETEVYRIQIFAPVAEGTEGGLYWGNTVIQSGRIGDEYYMTRGHFHRIRNRPEYYATIY